jgi:hypothetical protein
MRLLRRYRTGRLTDVTRRLKLYNTLKIFYNLRDIPLFNGDKMWRNGISHLRLIIFLCAALALSFLEANAQDYLPVGPQTNVPVNTVTEGGWTECFRNLYNQSWNVDELLSVCSGTRLMLACRSTGSDTLTLLAQADRNDVTFDTGNNQTVTHEANGSGWYFNTSVGSWGFVRAGDSVNKSECDTDTSGANNERLCWHTNNSGWRCGATQDLNGSVEFERIVYTLSPPRLAPIPTLSEWGLIAMAGVMGIAGYIIMRRRQAAA